MSVALTDPNLPESLQHLYDVPAMKVFDRWSNRTLDDVMSEMPISTVYEAPNGNQIKYFDIFPTTKDYDTEHILSLRLPFANRFSPHMFIRAKLMQDVLDVPQVVRVFANDTLTDTSTALRDEDIAKMIKGDLGPLAELQQRSIDHDFGCKNIILDASGYSLGGAIALKQALLAPTRSVDAVEFPNMVNRKPSEVDQAALNGTMSLRPYNRAILDSGIPALAEAFGVKRERSTLKQLTVGGLGFALNAKLLRNNVAIHKGLAHETATYDLEALFAKQPDISLVIGKAEGEIMPSDSLHEIRNRYINRFGSLACVAISGYAHEAADNPWVVALLSREARRGALL